MTTFIDTDDQFRDDLDSLSEALGLLEVAMNKKEPSGEKPDPRQAFGHPVTAETQPQYSDHKAGYDDSPGPSRAASLKDEARVGAVLPRRKAGKLPKVSLAERIRQRLSTEEKER